MYRKLTGTLAVVGCLMLPLLGGVETREKSLIKFSGIAGKMMGLFGGKAAKEGVVSTVAVVGDRKMTRTDTTGEIIDLQEERIYQVDWKKKTYKVVTFEEMRRQMEEAAEAMTQAGDEKESEEEQDSEPQYEVDFEVRETGQQKTVNGFEAREVVATITTRQKGNTLEAGGGMVLTSNLWLTDRIDGMDEILDFDRRYAEKLFGGAFGAQAAQFAAMSAMYPAMKDAFARFEAEKVNMEGTAVSTVLTMENVLSKEQAEQAKEGEESEPTSIGGMFGGLSKKFGKKDQPRDQPPGRTTVMTATTELLSVNTGIGAETVSLPAGFKEKN